MDVMSLEEIDALSVNVAGRLGAWLPMGKVLDLCHTAVAYHTQAAYITKLEVERGELLSAAEVANARIAELEAELRSFGYHPCDIAACNCDRWHGGHAERRLAEIDDLLNESGISTNGVTLIAAIERCLMGKSD